MSQPLRRTTLALAAAASALSCRGPSVDALLREDRVEQAFCRASDETDARRAITAMLAKLAPKWRVRRVLREDLPMLDDTFAEEVLRRYAILVVETRHARTSLDVSYLYGVATVPSADSPASRDESALAQRALDPSAFAELTGESAPKAKTTTETALVGPAADPRVVFLTLGLSLLFAAPLPHDVTRYPTEDELRAAAPRSASLYDALVARFGHASLVVLRRPQRGLRLQVELNGVRIDDHIGSFCGKSHSSARLELHGNSFAIDDPPQAWPAGVAFQPFDLADYRGEFTPGSGGIPIDLVSLRR